MAKKEIKTDSLILEPGTLPSVGVEGELRVDSADSNKLKKYDSASTSWKISGGTGGSGGINYIDNPDAESSITGWVLYEDAAGSVPVNGTGVAVFNEITFGRNTSSPLRDLADFLITKDGANRQGEGVSYDFTIDSADQAKIMRISFDYKTSAAYVDNDIGVYIYDVTNSQLIYPVDANLKASTLAKQFIAEFQTNSNSVAYRLIFHIASVNASAYTVNLDNVQVGPRELARGSVVGDWQSYTPTGSMSAGGSYYGKWRRNGDSMEGQVYFVASGAVSPSGVFTINLPSGYSIDSTKLPNSLADYHVAVGSGQVIDSAVRGYPLITYINSTTSVGFRSAETTGSSTSDVEDDSPITFGASDTLSGNFKVPILGWSSNAVISSDFGSRIIAANAYRSGNQTGVNTNNSTVKVNINAKAASGANGFDTLNVFDTVTNFRYDVPETGYYQVNGSINVAATNVLNDLYNALFRVSGSVARFGSGIIPKVSTAFNVGVSGIVYATAGQYIELYLYGQGNNSGSTLTVAGGADSTYLDVHKIQSPQTLMGSEVIAMRYNTNTATAVSNSSSVVIPFEDKVYDTHNAYNTSTGVYTVPVSGYYRISSITTQGNTSFTYGAARYVYSYISGSINSSGPIQGIWATASTYMSTSVNTTNYYTAGQTISITVQNGSGSTYTLNTSSTDNWVCIEKLN